MVSFGPPTLDLFVVLATIAVIYGVLSLGMNLHWGETGLINLAHAAFFAVGAYTTVVLTTPVAASGFGDRSVGFGLPVVVGVAAGAVLAAAVGVAVALITINLHGDYLAMATLALAEIIRHVIAAESWLTGGVQGVASVERPFVDALGTANYDLYYLAMACAVLVGSYLVLVRLKRAPFGRVLHAVREDEAVPRALGKDVTAFKLKAFGLGAGLAGLAGGLWAPWAQAINPVIAGADLTFLIWTAVILGGSGSYAGSVAGTFFLVGIYQGVRYIPTSVPYVEKLTFVRFIVVGVLMLLVLYYRPAGLFGDRRRMEAGQPPSGG